MEVLEKTEEDSLRGLEIVEKKAVKERKTCIKKHIEAVLEQQQNMALKFRNKLVRHQYNNR
jgi:hypothetical protein